MAATDPSTSLPAGDRGPSEFLVSGMTCQGCVRHVTGAIQELPEVASVLVQLDEGRAQVRWKPGVVADDRAVIRVVSAAGYSASIASPAAAGPRPASWSPLDGWRLNVVLGLAVTLPLMAGEWLLAWHHHSWWAWASFLAALPVQIICGARFYRGAWNQLRVGSSNMDTLVALGSTTAFGYSTWALFAGVPGHSYFMEAAAIITLISVGHWVEALASARAASSLRALMNLAPPVARRLDAAGQESEVPVAELKRGDQLVLRPGDRVPTDGVVTEGASAVDESMLTGESVPVEKNPSARLFTGTVNLNGRLVLRVEATGEQTALAHIIGVVQRAQSSRANIQRIGDRVASVFVPVVVFIALATGLLWGLAPESAHALARWLEPWLWGTNPPAGALATAVMHAAAVLIIACPCAMGLATPAAIMAGTNAAARRGILIRDGGALEKCGTLTAVVFDKTGTLTEGRLSVAAVEDLRPQNERQLALTELAAALARPSNHPLSRAVAALGTNPTAGKAAAAGGISFGTSRPVVQQWQEVRGAGLEARVLGWETVRLGSLNWLGQSGVDLTAAGGWTARWADEGATLLGLSVGNRLLGLLALRDTLKPHAAAVVQQLAGQGTRVFLITGDNRRTADAIARQAGIPAEQVFAEIRPEQKAEIVKQLQQRGERVAFVGDGINDAPALEQADLGVAVSRASDVAREAADVILLKSDIQAVPEALGLARATLRTIKQNLFWAFFYNAAGIPLAALGFLSPILCAAAMGLSDLVVIGNALRLRHWRGPR